MCKSRQVAWASKVFLWVKGNQMSHVKEFSAFLCMGRCKSQGSLKSLLSYASQLYGAWIVCFSYPEFLSAHLREWLQPNGCQIAGILPSWVPLGLRNAHWGPESLWLQHTCLLTWREYCISHHQLNCTKKVGRKFLCKWLSNTMAQWYDKGFTFYWNRILFEFEASDISIYFKVNSNAAFIHRDYLLVEKANSK